MSAHRDRLAAQAAEDRAQQQLQEARLHDLPDRPRLSHYEDVTDAEPCIGGRQCHDYTKKGTDGLRRCWYCDRLSPRSRAEIAAKGSGA